LGVTKSARKQEILSK